MKKEGLKKINQVPRKTEIKKKREKEH